MARAKSKIDNIDDFLTALKYIEKQLKNDPEYLISEKKEAIEYERSTKAIDIFNSQINTYKTKNDEEKFEKLNDWVFKNLTSLQYNRLRTTLRQERNRKKNLNKQVTLNVEAHHKLSEYAEKHNITFSQAILKLID